MRSLAQSLYPYEIDLTYKYDTRSARFGPPHVFEDKQLAVWLVARKRRTAARS